MKPITLSLLTFLLVQDSPISLTPGFQEGRELRLEIKRSREDSVRPSLGSPVTSIDLRVVKAGPDECLIEWVFRKTRIDDVRNPTQPTLQMTTDYEGMRIEVGLRRDGTFRIDDSEEVLSAIRVAMETMIQKTLLTIREDQRKQIEDSLRALVTFEVQRDFVMRDVWLFFAFYGLQFEVGKPMEQPLSVPYRLSSGDVQSRIRATLADVENRSGRTQVFVEHRYPRSAIEQIANDAMRQSRYSPPSAKAIPSTVAETVNLTFRTEGGYFEKIIQELVITHGDFRRVDRTEISVVEFR